MTWNTDILGPDFESLTIDLGPDPANEGAEGEIYATLVRHKPTTGRHALFFIHGMSDYFFQDHVAEFFTNHGFSVYAIDLRKCGRSLRPGQRPHHIRDLHSYDKELNAAMDIISSMHEHVTVIGHSTGGLIAPLWLANNPHPKVVSLVLNSPWLDIHVDKRKLKVLRPIVKAMRRILPEVNIPEEKISNYATSLAVDWDFNQEWKPLGSHKKTFGWLACIMDGQEELHKGLGLEMPVLVMRSDKSKIGTAATDADTVLMVEDMQYWAPRLGNKVSVVVVENGMHDLFLSKPEPREIALNEALRFIQEHGE
ncbi:MAG: alpha/beta hydrolase [Corynebacterium sp.]|nr:alpha/beta hydrolase [Corynebacterium sp.]